MAIFRKEADKNVKLQQQPPCDDKFGAASAAAPGAAIDEKPAVSKISPATATSGGRNCLDRGSRVSGKLYFDATVRIDGQVEGEITAEDGLVIGENAVITAQLNASSVVVAGKVSGDITASKRLELRPSAKVVGNLTSPILVIHEGASFDGDCTAYPDRAREGRKVTVFPKEERLAQVASNKQV
jgi:cytoskeletal protein CcmA (bactofilin family)